jgi:hypothetical protein
VTPEEFAVLLRVAGLDIDDERAPDVLAEFNAQLALARTLDPLLAGTEAPDLAPFDPAWPEVKVEEDRS